MASHFLVGDRHDPVVLHDDVRLGEVVAHESGIDVPVIAEEDVLFCFLDAVVLAGIGIGIGHDEGGVGGGSTDGL